MGYRLTIGNRGAGGGSFADLINEDHDRTFKPARQAAQPGHFARSNASLLRWDIVKHHTCHRERLEARKARLNRRTITGNAVTSKLHDIGKECHFHRSAIWPSRDVQRTGCTGRDGNRERGRRRTTWWTNAARSRDKGEKLPEPTPRLQPVDHGVHPSHLEQVIRGLPHHTGRRRRPNSRAGLGPQQITMRRQCCVIGPGNRVSKDSNDWQVGEMDLGKSGCQTARLDNRKRSGGW